MGAGKSVVARVLGERLGVSVADIDDMIEAEEGRLVADIFEREGEPYFREREGVLLRAVLASGARVIACGGGIVLDASNRALLEDRCDAVWLDVSPSTAAARVAIDDVRRPLLERGKPVEVLTRLRSERAPLYEAVARLRLVADQDPPERIADAIVAWLAGQRVE